MATSLYGLPSDNVAPNATISVVTGTEDTTYPAANLATLNPAKPAKLTTTTGRWVFDFTTAQQVDVVALIHTNLDAGLTVKVQANATNVWTSPSLDLAITIPALPEDSYPLNPWLDLTTTAVRSFRYWAIFISGTNTNPVAIGEVWLQATKRELDRGILLGMEETERRPAVVHTTDYGVATVYPLGPRLRSISGTIPADALSSADLLALERDAR